ncbi:polyketide synthase, partial [Gammaproteobacteria bacterium]|nr:polyketide synthase [Gammaproteobacteria bacterium]
MFIKRLLKRIRYNNDIAVIGITGRFPKSPSLDIYWDNLSHGKELITFFSDAELVKSGVPLDLINNSKYVKASPILKDYDKFDASFFKYSPFEAMIMDPQQRLMLECAWELFENAGYDVTKINYPVGVFTGAGSSISSYLIEYAKRFPEIQGRTATLPHLGNDKDFLSTLISYKLNLIGPSLTIQTACSTSLVCVYEACQSLLNDKCEIALAGASSIRVPQEVGYLWDPGHVYSEDGHCRAFDENSTGTLFGSGVGLVLLKRLSKAEDDNDFIYATIKGSEINNDGGNKLSYAASSGKGQLECINSVFKNTNISPKTIRYIESHGTGTLMGDQVEFNALTQAFEKYTNQKQFCAIGSIKSNLGHLDSASGIASLIAAILMLQNKKLIPSINIKKPSSKMDFKNSPFYFPMHLEDFKDSNIPYRIGVNSLGVGGT